MEFCQFLIHGIYTSVELPRPTDRTLYSQGFLEIKSCLKCLTRFKNPSTERRRDNCTICPSCIATWCLSGPIKVISPLLAYLRRFPQLMPVWELLQLIMVRESTYKHSTYWTQASVTVCFRRTLHSNLMTLYIRSSPGSMKKKKRKNKENKQKQKNKKKKKK